MDSHGFVSGISGLALSRRTVRTADETRRKTTDEGASYRSQLTVGWMVGATIRPNFVFSVILAMFNTGLTQALV